MYQVEYRAKLLKKHLDITYGQMAQSVGVTKKELLSWFKDKELVPEDKMSLLVDYFKLMESELFVEITMNVEYSFISDLSNQLNKLVHSYEQEKDTDVLISGLANIQLTLKDFLIEKQEELQIK